MNAVSAILKHFLTEEAKEGKKKKKKKGEKEEKEKPAKPNKKVRIISVSISHRMFFFSHLGTFIYMCKVKC